MNVHVLADAATTTFSIFSVSSVVVFFARLRLDERILDSPAEIAKQFDVQGRLVTVETIGSGNVNDTYRVIFRTTFDEQQIVLQRINQAVFPSPQKVMSNIQSITAHAREKILAEADEADRIWQLPKVIQTSAGTNHVTDGSGEVWRALSMIASAKSHERVVSSEHAVEAGQVLGHFQRLIADFPVAQLEDTLPGFHITPEYLARYDMTLQMPDGKGRANASSEAKRLTKFVEERREFASVLEDAVAQGELQHRPIHGEPKISSIMIDGFSGKGAARF